MRFPCILMSELQRLIRPILYENLRTCSAEAFKFLHLDSVRKLSVKELLVWTVVFQLGYEFHSTSQTWIVKKRQVLIAQHSANGLWYLFREHFKAFIQFGGKKNSRGHN